LPDSFVEILLVLGQGAHIGDGGDAHEHIIQPHGVLLGAVAGQGAVGQPVFLVHDVIHVVVNHGAQILVGPAQRGLNHGYAHGTGIVQSSRIQYRVERRTQRRIGFHGFPVRGYRLGYE